MTRLSDGPDGWIGVDFDRTLCYRGNDGGTADPGPPIPRMVRRVQRWVKEGKNVRIFTARAGAWVNPAWDPPEVQIRLVEEWCKKHLGYVLPVTCEKDFNMIELWDDACVAVEPNCGYQLSDSCVEGPA